MSITATDVITSALIYLGANDPGEAPNTSELNDGFARLNDLLASWSLERTNLFSVSFAAYNLSSGTSAYTIGTGQTINVGRPLKIEAANILMPATGSGNIIRRSLKLINDRDWDGIEQKGMTAGFPKKLYYDYAFPIGNLYLWPTPTFASSSRQIELFIWNALTQFVDLATPVTFPPGYDRAIRTALAFELASEYAIAPSASLQQQYAEAKAAIRTMNMSMATMPADPPTMGALNALPGH
jgi:hypothetical protein